MTSSDKTRRQSAMRSDLQMRLGFQKSENHVSGNYDRPRLSMFNQQRPVIGSGQGQRIAVVTAGDDTQGMNACIRAVARMGMYMDCTMIYIKQGYKGMVEGGQNFVEASWSSTTDMICQGGTVIKSCKCPEFRERWARLKAAKNLVQNDIHHLIAIGGDGTLHALDIFKNEWLSLLTELEDVEAFDSETLHRHRGLKAVGIISTVENNVVGTDIAIGVNSALHRIMECADDVVTAMSGSVAFILQVNGMYSGYLALASAIGCNATMCFIPEWPPEGDWKDELMEKVSQSTCDVMVMIAEGAIDNEGRPITPEEVAAVLESRAHLGTKITSLGNVQRGGTPTAGDRILASRLGAESLLALRDLPEEGGSCVMAMRGNDVIIANLKDIVTKTNQVVACIKSGSYCDAVRLRGTAFQTLLGTFIHVKNLKPAPILEIAGLGMERRVGVVRVGTSMLSVCTVSKSLFGYCLSKGISVVGFLEGFEGMIQNRMVSITWDAVSRWTYRTNSCLGSSKMTASSVGIDKIAAAIARHHLSALVIIGTFKGYESLWELCHAKDTHRELCIPMLMIPTSISNDVPGVDNSLGTDTALNEVMDYCDKMRRVARGQGNTVFIIETMGKSCGYLALLGGIAVGADAAYIKQEKYCLDSLLKDAHVIRDKVIHSGVKLALILMSESSSEDNYNLEFIHRLFTEEGKKVFTCKAATIGHIQMGGIPSAFDRIVGLLKGFSAGEWIVEAIENAVLPNGELYTKQPKASCVLGGSWRQIMFKPIVTLAAETDFQKKLPTFMWWMKLRPLQRILTKHYEEDYNIEAEETVLDHDNEENDMD